MNNKIKTILFASLIAAMILPFSGMNYATAEVGATPQIAYDSEMIQDIKKIISKEGKTKQVKFLDDGTKLKAVTIVNRINYSQYDVQTYTVDVYPDGERVRTDTIYYTINVNKDSLHVTTETQNILLYEGIITSLSTATPSARTYLDTHPDQAYLEDEDGTCYNAKYNVSGTINTDGTSNLHWAVDNWYWNWLCIGAEPLDGVKLVLESIDETQTTSTNGNWSPSHSYEDQWIDYIGIFTYSW